MIEWVENVQGVNPPAFYPRELVEVEYRDGRKASGRSAWTFSGWVHYPGQSRCDIMQYRILEADGRRVSEELNNH